MSWIEKVRQKPQATKIKIIWSIIVVIVLIMVLLWMLSAYLKNFSWFERRCASINISLFGHPVPPKVWHLCIGRKDEVKDTTLFQDFGKGINDVKTNLNSNERQKP